MDRKIIVLLVVMILLGGGIGLRSMKAQKYEEESTVTYEDLRRFEEKLDRILEIIKEKDTGNNKEVLARLDQVLSNQAKMQEELYIIKIRASR